MPKIIDLSGKKINNWTVIKRDESEIGKKKYKWICKCDCGKIYSVDGNHLRNGASSKCISCKYQGLKKKFPSRLWGQIRWGAKIRDIEFNLTKEFLFDLIKKQEYKCKITGLEIKFANTHIGHGHGECTASLDRIDSSKPYEEGNVQWVHKDINRMKWVMGSKEFFIICKLVYENNKNEIEKMNTKDFCPSSNKFKKDKNKSYEKTKITVKEEYKDL